MKEPSLNYPGKIYTHRHSLATAGTNSTRSLLSGSQENKIPPNQVKTISTELLLNQGTELKTG